MTLSNIEDAIAAIADGRLVVVVDDEDRENEGDLIMAAESVTPEAMAFMIRYTSGIICVPMLGERLAALHLPPMVAEVGDKFRTAFTVSVDYRWGTTTGVSAADRAATIRALADDASKPEDFLRPGHIFPLRYREGGVLMRAGHTEAAVDLCRLAGRTPAGILCELTNDDGTMMRMPDLAPFAREHGLPLISIADLIRYRRLTEKIVTRLGSRPAQTDFGTFRLYQYQCTLEGTQHYALVKGTIAPEQPVTVRVHAACDPGDLFADRGTRCHGSLAAGLKAVAAAESGVLIYLRVRASFDESLRCLRCSPDAAPAGDPAMPDAQRDWRDNGIGAQILADLGVRRIRLLTSSSRKYVGLPGFNLEIVGEQRLPDQAGMQE